jgi:hypothetical protein
VLESGDDVRPVELWVFGVDGRRSLWLADRWENCSC